MGVDLLIAIGSYVCARVLLGAATAATALREPALIVLAGALFVALGIDTQPYQVRLRSQGFLLRAAARRWLFALAATLTVGFLHPAWAPERASMILTGVLGLTGLMTLRIAVVQSLRWWRRRGHSYKHALIIGTGDQARRALHEIESQPDHGLRVIGFIREEQSSALWRYRDIPCLGALDDLAGILKRTHVDYALFCLGEESRAATRTAIRECTAMGVAALILTDWFSELGVSRRAFDFLGTPALLLDPVRRPSLAAAAKDAMDILGAGALSLLLLPIMLVTAAAIWLDDRGPVLFSQVRLGLNGRPFRMLKFRTMGTDAEAQRPALESLNEMSGPVFKITDDPRVTRIGRWLRRTSIDELPQLLNVIKGDMSLVGPRPPLPTEVLQYDPWQRRRLSVKPGMTGLWQVGGRNNIDFDEWMRLDLEYIDNWSMKSDAGILLRTIPAVLKRNGAR